MTTYTLTRTVDDSLDCAESKRVRTWRGLTLREIGQMVAFCAVDNCRLDRSAGTRYGMLAEQAAKQGKAFALNEYEFRAVAE